MIKKLCSFHPIPLAIYELKKYGNKQGKLVLAKDTEYIKEIQDTMTEMSAGTYNLLKGVIK